MHQPYFAAAAKHISLAHRPVGRLAGQVNKIFWLLWSCLCSGFYDTLPNKFHIWTNFWPCLYLQGWIAVVLHKQADQPSPSAGWLAGWPGRQTRSFGLVVAGIMVICGCGHAYAQDLRYVTQKYHFWTNFWSCLYLQGWIAVQQQPGPAQGRSAGWPGEQDLLVWSWQSLWSFVVGRLKKTLMMHQNIWL